jgi:NhaP-type Na+/H+ and K+/H+ antiporter
MKAFYRSNCIPNTIIVLNPNRACKKVSYSIKKQNQQLAAQIMQQAQMKQQVALAQLRQQQQLIMQTGDIIRAGQERRMAASEQNFNAMDNIVAGNIDLRGLNGQVYNVSNDYQPRHWIDGLGQVHGGGWNTVPSPNWTPLETVE